MIDNQFILGPSSSPETAELTKALAKAHAEYQAVALDSSNPHFRSKFSSYAQCCDSLRGPLTKNGIALPDFRPGLVGPQWVLVGTLRHTSGQYITGIAPLINPKGDMQGFGAAMTYAKRTLLMALTGGFSGEADDDGQSVQQVAKPDVARQATTGMEIEARATLALAEAKTVDAALKVVDLVKLRVAEKACSKDVLMRIQRAFSEKFPKQEV
jgi:ERF superfamily